MHCSRPVVLTALSVFALLALVLLVWLASGPVAPPNFSVTPLGRRVDANGKATLVVGVTNNSNNELAFMIGLDGSVTNSSGIKEMVQNPRQVNVGRMSGTEVAIAMEGDVLPLPITIYYLRIPGRFETFAQVIAGKLGRKTTWGYIKVES